MEEAGTSLRLPSQTQVKKRMKWRIFKLTGSREMAQWVNACIVLWKTQVGSQPPHQAAHNENAAPGDLTLLTSMVFACMCELTLTGTRHTDTF